MKQFIVPETTFKDHSRSLVMTLSSFTGSPGHCLRDRKSMLDLYSDKIAEMTLKVDQGHWLWHNSVGHISLFY